MEKISDRFKKTRYRSQKTVCSDCYVLFGHETSKQKYALDNEMSILFN